MRPVTWEYKFVEPGYTSDRLCFVETHPRTIAYCAERLALDDRETGVDPSRLPSPERSVLVFEQLPPAQEVA